LRRGAPHVLALLAAIFLGGAEALSRDPGWHAGFLTLAAGADPGAFSAVAGSGSPKGDSDSRIPVSVWYPTRGEESPQRLDGFTLSVAPAAEPGEGPFPLVLLSHDSFGSPLDHRELAADLARHGFVVVAPTHIGDAVGERQAHDTDLVYIGRAWQAVAALDAALADPRLARAIDGARIGMMGLGTGGYTGLVVAGAEPDFGRWPLYCDGHMSDFALCGGSAFPAVRILRPGWHAPHDRRVKALVALAPLGLPFGRGSLDKVTIPVRLYEAMSDTVLLREPNAAAILAALPLKPEHAVVAGGHFVFLDPCPVRIAGSLRALCVDAAGVDRAAIHRRLEAEIRDFFERVL
jgi:predicted dienelactone hydrolase